jgi:methylenetetrahydrofolate reductase (NADPH)
VKISEILARRRPSFSFEFFPPKDDAGMKQLLSTIDALRALEPSFVSVTYRPGGSTGTRTIEVTTAIKRDLHIEAMAHITCVGSTVRSIHEVLRSIADSGVENILALRGDPPAGAPHFVATDDALAHASDLTRIAAHYGFCIGGACYPEKHPESPDAPADMRALCAKVEAGAEFLITQLFFDNDAYFEFVGRARRMGVDVPIIPGIMPITGIEQIERFTRMCGASIPRRLFAELSARRAQPEAVLDLGVAYATLQCADLLARGAPAIHFYTLNRSPAARAVVSALLAARPWEPARGLRYLESADAIVESALALPEIEPRSY